LSQDNYLEDFFRKENVKIAVVDSGLGGLSILTEAANRLEKTRIFPRAEFLFYNALFSSSGGYNALNSKKEKIDIFNSALQSLAMNYSPDMILIGCNTLSVLLYDTDFYRSSSIPVVGILETGVNIIGEKLRSFPESEVIILGTQTTIMEDSHRKKLVQMGVLENRIHTQACPELVAFIEKDRTGDDTEMLILAYLDEAVQKMDRVPDPLLVSLNCTHYGYSLDLWNRALKELNIQNAVILDPNISLIDDFLATAPTDRFSQAEISVSVVSMVKIGTEQIKSIGEWLKERSIQVAEALENYEFKPDLFEWKKFIKPKTE
jgi:glutamate racemase